MWPPADSATQAIALTRAWVDRAVIGLNLCPFAKAVQARNLIRTLCSDARDPAALHEQLRDELVFLAAAPIGEVETTLLVHPWVLQDFLAYNDFLDEADQLLRELGLEGVLQVASFHPDYCFADCAASDITNATNRSPYPTLHLLREASIDRAVAAFPQAEAIYETNQRRLRQLGPRGWAALQRRCLRDAVGG
jgi:uncharacterized protein